MARAAKRRRSDRQRWRRQLGPIVGFMVLAVGLAWFFEAQATTTLIFVRHAEKASVPEADPGLTDAGQARARALARVLHDVDVVAGVDAIYTSQFRRAQRTAAPLANALELDVNVADADAVAALMESILRKHKGEIVLIVGHSDTIAPMIAELGGSKKLPEIVEDEYDNLYIVTIPWFGKVKTLRLRYGAGFPGS